MNILMLRSKSCTHDPRVFNEAKSLVKAGHKVTVLFWNRRNEGSPIVKKDGIEFISSYNTKFMELLPHDFFRFRYWWNQGYKDALRLHKERHFDVVHCNDYDTLPIGVKLKKRFCLPLIYDTFEIWGYMVGADLPKTIANYFLKQEQKLLKYVDRFIIAEDKYADYFKNFTNKKMISILNCKYLISRKYEPPKNDIFTLLYLGSFDKNRFLLELVDVVKEIPDIKCIIGGIKSRTGYYNALVDKCSKVKNVDFIGRIPREDVVPMTKIADVIVCMIYPGNINTKLATANKQFEAMVCGRPIICTKETRSGEITEEEKCGLVVDYKKDALKEAIIKLRDSPKLCKELGQNALKAAINKYNWEIEEKKLLKLYEEIEEESNKK